MHSAHLLDLARPVDERGLQLLHQVLVLCICVCVLLARPRELPPAWDVQHGLALGLHTEKVATGMRKRSDACQQHYLSTT